MTAFEEQVSAELPLRSAHLTFTETGYDGDPNSISAPDILNFAGVGTWFRELAAGTWWRKTETVWQKAGALISGTTLTYKESGSEIGPAIFGEFLALYNQLELIRADNGGDFQGRIVLNTELVPSGTLTVPVRPVVQSGSPTAAFTFSNPTMTLTDAGAAFTTASIDQFITIAGLAIPANNGTFRITGVPSPGTVEYENAAGVAEAQGVATYSITNPYDFTGVIFDGGPFAATLNFADGVTTIGLRSAENFVDIVGNNTLHPVEILPNPTAGVVMGLRSNCAFSNAGSEPLFDVATNNVGFLLIVLYDGSRIANNANGAGGVFGGTNVGDGFQAGSVLFMQVFDANPVQPPMAGAHRPTAIKGATGALLIYQIENTRAAGVTAGSAGDVFPSWQGTILPPQFTEPAFLIPNPFQAAPSTVAVTAALGEALSLNASSAPIAQPLPSINAASFGYAFPGGLFAVSEVGGGQVTLSAAGGDTIAGAASLLVPPRGGVLLKSNGISNWEVIATFNPANGTSLVYEPGSTHTGPVAFSDWNALMVQLNFMRLFGNDTGGFTIFFSDRSLAASFDPIIIPVGGPYDMRGVDWDGSLSRGGANVHISDGASFLHLRSFSSGIFLRNLNTTNPADDTLGLLTTVDQIRFNKGCDIAGVAGGAPLYGNGNMTSGDFFICNAQDRSTLGNNSDGPLFDIPSGVVLVVALGFGCRIESSRNNILVGAEGALLITIQQGSDKIRKSHPSWAGTVISELLDDPASLATKPYKLPASTVALTAGFGEHLRLSVRGGAIAQTLPDISSSNLGAPGGLLTVVEASNASGLSLVPAAGDTMAGAKRAGQVLTLTGQPLNNETVVAGGKTYTFQTVLTDVDGNVLIDPTNASNSLDNLIAAIVLGAGAGSQYATLTTPNTAVDAVAGTGDTMVASALALGTAGNALVSTETLTNGSWGAATLLGGTNGSLLVAAGGGVILESDGLSHWDVVGFFNPNQGPGAKYAYRPGGTGIGPVVFSDWNVLEAAKEANRALAGGNGLYDIHILIDDTIVSPAVIPANGTNPNYNFAGCTLEGTNLSLSTRLDFADGCHFVDLRRIGSNLGVRNLNSTAPAEVVTTSATIEIGFASFVNSAGGQALWSGSGQTAGDFFQFILGAFAAVNFNFGGGSGTDAVIDMPVSGTGALIGALNNANVPFNGIEGVTGTLLIIRTQNMEGVPNAHTGFNGTLIFDAIDQPANLFPRPQFAAAATAALATPRMGQWFRLNASGGAIAQPLPAIGAANQYKQTGVFVAVTEEGGGTGLALDPDGSDTIEGGTANFPVPAKGGLLLMQDGVSNWKVIASFDPSHAPPDRLIYQPGGTGIGPVVFSDWTALLAQLTLIKLIYGNAQIELGYDDSISSPISIPVGGPYDMTNVTQTSARAGGFGSFAASRVVVPEGVTFIGLRTFGGSLTFTNEATSTVPDTSLANNEFINVGGDAHLENTGSVALWSGSGLTGLVILVVSDAGKLGFTAVPTAPFIDMPVAATTLVAVSRESGLIRENSFSGIVGSVLSAAVDGDSARARVTHSGFLGTIIQQAQGGFWRVNIDQALITTTPVALSNSAGVPLKRFDTTAGNKVANLPSAAASTLFRGDVFFVKNEVGPNNVSVVPLGGETIDSVNAPLVLGPGQAATFFSNGLGNWTAIFAISSTPGAGGAMNVTGPFSTAGPHAVAINDLSQADATSVQIGFTLPAISTTNKGKKIIVKVKAGGNGASIASAGGNTFDDLPSPLILPNALDSVTLKSDGTSNWIIT